MSFGILIAVLVLLLILLAVGIPVPFSFFGISLLLVFLGGYDTSFLLPYGYTKVSSYVLLAIPLFILAGGIIERSSMGEKLVNFVELFVGKVKGSLGVVAVISCAIFGAISGSATAAQTVIGSNHVAENGCSRLSERKISSLDCKCLPARRHDSSERTDDHLCVDCTGFCPEVLPGIPDPRNSDDDHVFRCIYCDVKR